MFAAGCLALLSYAGLTLSAQHESLVLPPNLTVRLGYPASTVFS